MNAIQTNCPWLLRYLAACTVIAKGFPLPDMPVETTQNEEGEDAAAPKEPKKYTLPKNLMNKIIKIIEEEKGNYSDPITEFIEALFVRFDFDAAQACLGECAKLLATDFFLEGFRASFLEAARRLVFETHCRIYTNLSLVDVAEKLGMPVDEAERWTVDLIRSANLEAKIDSDTSTMIMAKETPQVYQQIIDSTKDLTYRSYQLFNKIRHAKNKGRNNNSSSNNNINNNGAGGHQKGSSRHHHNANSGRQNQSSGSSKPKW